MSGKKKLLRPCVLWFTGLSGSGKSTVASQLKRLLAEQDCAHYLLDGDLLREGLCKDLGFSENDRAENIRRIGEVAKLFSDEGRLVIVATISPLRKIRADVRARFNEGDFVEIFIDSPLSVCEYRDPKGLYRKARSGQLINFTGIDAIYEAPIAPEIHLDTNKETVAANISKILDYLYSRRYLNAY